MSTKRKGGVQDEDSAVPDNHLNIDVLETPTKRKRGRPSGSVHKSTPTKREYGNGTASGHPTPLAKGKLLFSAARTLPKTRTTESEQETPTPKKQLNQRQASEAEPVTVTDSGHDGLPIAPEEDSEDDLEGDNSETSDRQLEDEPPAASSQPTTPSKRQRKTSRRKVESPTPPSHLPPHEQYFFQTQAKNAKTSNNTLSSLSLLSHSEYHDVTSAYEDPHISSIRFLHTLHARSFPQWRFELGQKFSVCLYGYGSKRQLVTDFASYLNRHSLPSSTSKIVIVNGYTPALGFRKVLSTLASAIYDTPIPTLPIKIGVQYRETISTLLSHLQSHPPEFPIHLFVNSLDAAPFRRNPIPTLLAQLAASSHISLLATCDTPNFPLLWDTTILEQYNFVFHDTTTFVSYADAEITGVIDDVNELLGRSGRTVKGKEGVGFVLRSLPENARNLYRLLVAEVLTMMAEGDDAGDAGLGEGAREEGGTGGNNRKEIEGDISVDYRILYQKAADDFVCSSEVAFRTLLKEFHDHQMVVSRRDGLGGEVLSVPFRREEMETILEDLVS